MLSNARKGLGKHIPHHFLPSPPAKAPCHRNPPRAQGERTPGYGPCKSGFQGTEEEKEVEMGLEFQRHQEEFLGHFSLAG